MIEPATGTLDGVAYPVQFFSFDTNGGASTFDLAAASAINEVCIGAAAAFGGTINGLYCGPGDNAGYVILPSEHSAVTAYTSQDAVQLELMSFVTTTPLPAAATPATWRMLASALAAAASLRLRSRRFRSAVAA
jgi:hypothetical protein